MYTAVMPRRRRTPPPEPDPRPTVDIDLNQVVAYNVRAARDLRGWTQEELADYLEPYLGQRLTQAGISSIERAWDSDRRREFDAHELLIFAVVFDLPMIWFLLPPPGDRRTMRGTARPISEIYSYLLGQPHQLEPLYQRLKELGNTDTTAAEDTVEILTGMQSDAGKWSYRERRKDMLLALLDQHADQFDDAIDQLSKIVDHLRHAGIRGFVAEHTHDDDFTYKPDQATDPPPTTDKTAPDATTDQQEEPGGTT